MRMKMKMKMKMKRRTRPRQSGERHPRMEQWSCTGHTNAQIGQRAVLLLPFRHKLDVSKVYP